MKLAAISCWAALCCLFVGCESAIVGASCRTGYAVCADGCVDLQVDHRNCGECGNNCGRFLCEAGACTHELRDPDPGAGTPDAGEDAGEDAGHSQPDSGMPESCGLGFLDCDGSCVDATRDRDHCGACDHACGAGEFCTGAQCYRSCEGGLQLCGGECRDVSSDPDHCGRCNSPCESGICRNGSCDDRFAGHVVVIGHDLTEANNAIRRIAGNAVFLASGAPVRVLEYRGEANPVSLRGVEDALSFSQRELGRDWIPTEALDALVPLQLTTADVFLIHAQENASNSALQKLGQQWASAIAQFLERGGVVVLFDAPTAANDGTFQILEPAKVFSAGARVEVSGPQQMRVQTPGQGVVLRVPERYMSTRHTVSFTDMSSAATALVIDEAGQPVVVERSIVVQ